MPDPRWNRNRTKGKSHALPEGHIPKPDPRRNPNQTKGRSHTPEAPKSRPVDILKK